MAKATPFATMIREIRAEVGLSQSALARMLAVDHSAVSRWESGNRVPTQSMIDHIVSTLELGDDRRCALYVAAGYEHPPALPVDRNHPLARLHRALTSQTLDESYRTGLLYTLSGLADQAEIMLVHAMDCRLP